MSVWIHTDTNLSHQSATLAVGRLRPVQNWSSAKHAESVKVIEMCAFASTRLTYAEISNGVSVIGDWAFYNCSDLTEITIPRSVIYIGDRTFECCHSLKEVNWESPIRPTKEMLDKIFAYCPNLKSINYHGTKIELKSNNLDEVIKDASTALPNEPIPNLYDIIKNAYSER